MRLELTGRVTDVGGLRAGFYTTGTYGYPVVLLHGGGTDSAMLSWRETIPALAAEYRVYAPDWPGFGLSEPFVEEYTLDRLGDWMHELFNRWELQQAVLVGISMGGGAALNYTLNHTQRVSKLVLVDSYGLQRRLPGHRLGYLYMQMPWLQKRVWTLARNSRAMAQAMLGGIYADRKHISPELVEEVFQSLQDPQPEETFSRFQRFEMLPDRLRTCYLERLSELDLPVLIIHGEKDALVPLRDAREAARRIQGSRLEVIPNAGHWPMREQPAVFNRVLREFLAAEK
jgi:pimeloyl-ACP methyl ester carboxylesterase